MTKGPRIIWSPTLECNFFFCHLAMQWILRSLSVFNVMLELSWLKLQVMDLQCPIQITSKLVRYYVLGILFY